MPLPLPLAIKIFFVSYIPLGLLLLYGIPSSIEHAWVQHPFFALVLPFALHILLLAYTGPSSILRWALLPIFALNIKCYHSLSLQVMDTRASAAGFEGPMILLFLGAVDSLLIQGLYLDAGKHECSRGTGASADAWSSRLKWAAHVVWSYRSIGTPRQAKNLPRFGAGRPSRGTFILQRVLAAAGNYVVLDIISAMPPYRVTPEAAWLLPPRKYFTLEDLWTRAVTTLLFWTTLRVTIAMLYNAISIVGVATFLNEPEDWPPYFGSVTQSTSLRNFWGLYWHAGLRLPMVANANFLTYDVLRLGKGTLVARYLSMFITFSISGLIHRLVDNLAGVPDAENTTLNLFVVQTVGIILEDFAIWAYKQMYGEERAERVGKDLSTKMLGWIWVAAFHVVATPPMSYSHITYELDRLVKPGPAGLLLSKQASS